MSQFFFVLVNMHVILYQTDGDTHDGIIPKDNGKYK